MADAGFELVLLLRSTDERFGQARNSILVMTEIATRTCRGSAMWVPCEIAVIALVS